MGGSSDGSILGIGQSLHSRSILPFDIAHGKAEEDVGGSMVGIDAVGIHFLGGGVVEGEVLYVLPFIEIRGNSRANGAGPFRFPFGIVYDALRRCSPVGSIGIDGWIPEGEILGVEGSLSRRTKWLKCGFQCMPLAEAKTMRPFFSLDLIIAL